ncbi:MAG: hypothetical protein RID53_08415 [Coleofasciculus sp. B1-GNL1-01]|uniref:hypothetical protein n=1 Tax=Coleofasciculus sp. B1-GNL1-01 TaxID=3068484 RepID=UPI0032F916CC
MDNLINVAREAHLLGGLRAINKSGSRVAVIVPNIISNKKHERFNISSYHDFIAKLRELKLELIGIDFYTSSQEILGIYPPEWYSFSRIMSTSEPLNDPVRAWNNISFYAYRQQNYCLADITGRISFELNACELRLRDLSESYYKELLGLCNQNTFEVGKRFKTLNSFNIYLAVHSFLVESCSLRDYLAEFMRLYVFHQKYGNEQVSTMGALRKKILKKEHEYDVLAKNLYEATDPDSEDGWLAKLGEYRDLVVHSVPLEQASTRSFLVQKLSHLGDDKCLPSIALPLPANPGNISAKRSKGIYFSSFDEWLAAVQKDAEESKLATDALEYCCLANANLTQLATDLVKYSPIKPKTPVFTEEDIIEMRTLE